MTEQPISDAADDQTRTRHAARTETLFASIKEGLRTILGAMAIALTLRSFGYEPFNIPSESMLPRLLVGDYLFVAKWPYGYSRYSLPLGLPLFEGRMFGSAPEPGDIAVFKNPYNNRADFIKRVIGLPGDQIQMRGGVLYLNGRAVPKVRIADLVVPVTPNSDCQGNLARPSWRAMVNGRLVCRYPRYRETLPNGRSYAVLDQVDNAIADNTGVYVVPAGHYFMMGDNRDDSADSRFSIAEQGIGFVPAENLVGRAAVIFFSTDGSAELLKPWTWVTALRVERVGQTL